MEVWVNHRNFAHLVHEPGYYGALTETDRIMKKNLYYNEIAIMKRLTITLSEARYRALKEASVQRNKTMGQLIDESLELYGIKTREEAQELLRRARSYNHLTEAKALKLANKHVRVVRGHKSGGQ